MRVLNFDYPELITTTRPMVLYLFSDLHIGNVGFDEKLLQEHIEMCRRENAYWMIMGDLAEAINPKDSRFDVRTCTNPVLSQYERIAELFEPIADRGICILEGNHDAKISESYGDFTALVAKMLKVPYVGYSSFINVRMWHSERRHPQHSYRMFAHHGHGGGRKAGSKVNNLQDLSSGFDADLYIIGHVHTYSHTTDAQLSVGGCRKNKSKIVVKKRDYIICPSYLDGYSDADASSYIEKKAFQPQSVGCVRVELYRDGDGINIRVIPLLK